MTDYAKRLHAIRDKWRWMPGMLAERIKKPWGSARVIDVKPKFCSIIKIVFCYNCDSTAVSENYVPDITDPATRGCLVAQVREVIPSFNVVSVVFPNHPTTWTAYYETRMGVIEEYIHEDTEAECILAALEAM